MKQIYLWCQTTIFSVIGVILSSPTVYAVLLERSSGNSYWEHRGYYTSYFIIIIYAIKAGWLKHICFTRVITMLVDGLQHDLSCATHWNISKNVNYDGDCSNCRNLSVNHFNILVSSNDVARPDQNWVRWLLNVWGPFYRDGLTLVMDNVLMLSKMWDKIFTHHLISTIVQVKGIDK